MSQKIIGKKAEDVAFSFLKKNGLDLIERNYHCRFGEIDLIMQDKDVIVFVEVRYRKSDTFGSAIDSVDPQKRRKLVFTANHFLSQHGNSLPTRFDVVAITPYEPPQWIIDAFSADDG